MVVVIMEIQQNLNCTLEKIKMLANSDIANYRRSICEQCEHNKVSVCAKCFCIIPVKTSLKNSKCPKGKW